MDLKRNWAYYGIFIFVVSMQLYFMKCNSGLQKMMPILSRLNENEMGEEYVLVYMAFLTPVIILILYFAEWKDFYVDSYGVLKLSRSVNIYSYVARLLLKIGKQVFTFVVLSVLINYIVDYKYANNHFDKMFFDFFDYFMTIFNMCIFVFLISLYIKRTAAAVVCIIFSIIGNCVLNTEHGIASVFLFNHIVKNGKYNGIEEYIEYILLEIALCVIFYFACVWKIKNRDFYGGRYDG